MMQITLPFWMSKRELKKLKDASQSFWEKVEMWFRISLTKFDLMTCDLIIVDYVAWERKIERLENEDELIYRKRVDYAFVNAEDAGMTAGIYRIFDRLGVPIYDIKERQPDRDWDIVTLELDSGTLAGQKELINLLIQTYGATCRRYEYNVTNKLPHYTHYGQMTCSYKSNIVEFYVPKPISITLSENVKQVNEGDTGRAIATIEFDDGTTSTTDEIGGVIFSSKNQDVLKIDNLGNYQAIAPGIAEIRTTVIDDNSIQSIDYSFVIPNNYVFYDSNETIVTIGENSVDEIYGYRENAIGELSNDKTLVNSLTIDSMSTFIKRQPEDTFYVLLDDYSFLDGRCYLLCEGECITSENSGSTGFVWGYSGYGGYDAGGVPMSFINNVNDDLPVVFFICRPI